VIVGNSKKVYPLSPRESCVRQRVECVDSRVCDNVLSSGEEGVSQSRVIVGNSKEGHPLSLS
jgi:hypothetical protein